MVARTYVSKKSVQQKCFFSKAEGKDAFHSLYGRHKGQDFLDKGTNFEPTSFAKE